MKEAEEVSDATPPGELERGVGLLGATMMGLGSIVGTGVFVSIAIGAGAAGPSVVLAIVVGALVAVCNGLSSAQLAAAHPVSGGTYEYGYRWLNPAWGFTAGWMFLSAKSASAATAALGFASYLLPANLVATAVWTTGTAVFAVAALTILVLTGIRRSNAVNIAIVTVSLAALATFVLAGVPVAWREGRENLEPFFAPVDGRAPLAGLLEACALMFVAYTGYGRIATLAEEVHHPRRTIPLAIIVTLGVSMALYASVGLVGVAAVGAEAFAGTATEQAAPLEWVARQLDTPLVAQVVSIGAVTAMLGVLLNLVLGLSRVVLAMGRRRDLPHVFSRIAPGTSTPQAAVLLVGAGITGLVLIGDVKTTWSFSAFTVLIYYAITNLAALRIAPDQRLYPRAFAVLGLVACLFLAFWVEPHIWMIGLGLIAAGLVWHLLAQRLAARRAE